ncbi:hypothetical protein RZN22_03245 [Bacillaceae bacterium S4-13-58]
MKWVYWLDALIVLILLGSVGLHAMGKIEDLLLIIVAIPSLVYLVVLTDFLHKKFANAKKHRKNKL